jgi:hypothetical protein
MPAFRLLNKMVSGILTGKVVRRKFRATLSRKTKSAKDAYLLDFWVVIPCDCFASEDAESNRYSR